MSIISSIIDMVSEVVVNDPFFHRSLQFAVQRFYSVLIMGGSASRFVCPRPKRALTHVRIVCCQLAPVGGGRRHDCSVLLVLRCVRLLGAVQASKFLSTSVAAAAERHPCELPQSAPPFAPHPLVCSPIHISHPPRPDPCGFLCKRATSACMGGGRGVSEP